MRDSGYEIRDTGYEIRDTKPIARLEGGIKFRDRQRIELYEDSQSPIQVPQGVGLKDYKESRSDPTVIWVERGMNYEDGDLEEKEGLREGTLRSIVRSILLRHRDRRSEGAQVENDGLSSGTGGSTGGTDSGDSGRVSQSGRMRFGL